MKRIRIGLLFAAIFAGLLGVPALAGPALAAPGPGVIHTMRNIANSYRENSLNPQVDVCLDVSFPPFGGHLT